VDVVPEVVTLLRGEVDCALTGELIEPGMVLSRQVLVGEVVEGEAPYRTANRAELVVDGVLAPEPVELMQAASELADARKADVVRRAFPAGRMLPPEQPSLQAIAGARRIAAAS
jgi:hypothetical protein